MSTPLGGGPGNVEDGGRGPDERRSGTAGIPATAGSAPGDGPAGGHGDEGASRERPGSASEVPDPDPADTPGLDAGGSVQPGDTPPSEAGTSGLSAPDPKQPSRNVNAIIAVSIVVLALAAVLAFFVARLAG